MDNKIDPMKPERTIMDDLIYEHLHRFGENNLFRASLDHFRETGQASGSFRSALHAMMEEYRQSSPIESKWVKASERLPEVSTSDPWRIESSFSDDVLVAEGGRRWFGYYTPKYGGAWIVPDRMGGINVTHWQPLPELPIEETKEK